jgi:hypothetical protein
MRKIKFLSERLKRKTTCEGPRVEKILDEHQDSIESRFIDHEGNHQLVAEQ